MFRQQVILAWLNGFKRMVKYKLCDSIVHAFWESYEVQKLWAELESWLSEVLQCKLTFNPSVCIFQDMA